MRMRFVLTLISFWPLLPFGALAQSASADVTFEVPLNLTALPSYITKIRVTCALTSEALPSRRLAKSEVAVSQGQVMTTVQVVFPILSSDLTRPSGQSADYECTLAGFESTGQLWLNLGGARQVVLPQPVPITGTFWW